MRKILIIEDEQSIADTLVHSLEREGYAVSWCMRALPGLELAKSGEYALLILDVGLPDMNGFELCKEIRKFSALPVIFLTARDDEVDKVVGLEIGADDYVTKPFSPRELAARVKSVLRRSPSLAPGQENGRENAPEGSSRQDSPRENCLASSRGRLNALLINAQKMQAVYCGQALELTRYEFRLLALLAETPGHVYSRETLMQRVWDNDSPSLDRTVDAHIKSLRAKFREIRPETDPFITRRGSGYSLREDL